MDRRDGRNSYLDVVNIKKDWKNLLVLAARQGYLNLIAQHLNQDKDTEEEKCDF